MADGGARFVRARGWLAAVVAGGVCGVVVLPPAGLAAPAVPVQLSATDVALLNGVRLAGLWEIPGGSMAAEKGSRAVVRQVGAEIAKQHVALDELAVEAANQLGAEIPAEPTGEQKQWLGEMERATGDRFDRIFVDRLRVAHGKIFPVIGAVRAGTRNPVIRKLAEQANGFVMTHMRLLESTGLVRYTELPPAAVPGPQDTSGLALARANVGPGPGFSPMLIWGVLVAALLTAVVTAVRLRRPW